MSKDGGHAFPNITPDMNVDGGPGMTLRDYFAAHAPPMPEWWHSLWLDREKRKASQDDRYQMRGPVHAMAAWALDYADAMLAAREES